MRQAILGTLLGLGLLVVPATASTPGVPAAGAAPAAALCSAPFTPFVETDGKEHLSPDDTTSDNFGTPGGCSMTDVVLGQYAHWRSSTWVSITSLDDRAYESVTYTNWSAIYSHYVQTWVKWWYDDPNGTTQLGPGCSGGLPCDGSPGPLSDRDAPGTAASTQLTARPAAPLLVKALVPVSPGRAATAIATCPGGTVAAHAEGRLTWKTAPLHDDPPVSVARAGMQVRAHVAGGLVHARGVFLKALAVCAADAPVVAGSTGHVRVGTNGPESVRTSDTGEIVYAGAGNDAVAGGKADDTIFGDDGNDALQAGGGSDVLIGGTGNDTLRGGNGKRDILVGGPGSDRLIGGPAADNIDARDGKADDVVTCGAGKDVVLADRGDKVAHDCERVIWSR